MDLTFEKGAATYPYIYGVSPRILKSDIFYKIFVTPRAICGAKLAGQIFDETTAEYQMLRPARFLRFLILPWVRKVLDKRYELEAEYDEINALSQQFLEKDKDNFRFDSDFINKVTINRQRRLWTDMLPNSGTLTFYLKDNTQKEFILVYEQDISNISRLIGQVVSEIDIVK